MPRTKTKLAEKPARIPDPRPAQWEAAKSQYLRDAQGLPGESARSHRFAMFLQQLLGVSPDFIESYVAGIETWLKVRQKDRLLRGKADNLFGNVVIEFEGDLAAKRSEAEEQLRRYVAILWSQEPSGSRRPYLCVATDGVRFVTFAPTLSEPGQVALEAEEVRLVPLEEADWSRLKADEVYYWLDRYFSRPSSPAR